jgi:hypothetical protein
MRTVSAMPGALGEVKVIETVCPVCGCELELHQPDESLADRLLATCGECKSWFLATAEGRPLVGIPGTGPVGRRRPATRSARVRRVG